MLFAGAPHSIVAFSISENPRTENENEAVYLPRLIDWAIRNEHVAHNIYQAVNWNRGELSLNEVATVSEGLSGILCATPTHLRAAFAN